MYREKGLELPRLGNKHKTVHILVLKNVPGVKIKQLTRGKEFRFPQLAKEAIFKPLLHSVLTKPRRSNNGRVPLGFLGGTARGERRNFRKWSRVIQRRPLFMREVIHSGFFFNDESIDRAVFPQLGCWCSFLRSRMVLF